jgi:thiol-disulfide isomerase/thioredoxin
MELAMNRNLQIAEKGATAEHIAVSNVFMAEQRLNMLALRQAHDLVLHKDVIASLAPQDGDINDFAYEHEAVCGRRHENTCRWVLEHRLFASWLAVPPEQNTILWITAGPGAGKSTLTSFVIDHLRTNLQSGSASRIAFFYFKASSTSQNNAADAMCSLTWQLCDQSEAARAALESDALYYSLDTTGLRTSAKVKNSRTYKASQQLKRVLQATPDAVILIDGLDECQDCDAFLPMFLELCQQANIKALFTSRREEQIAQHLRSSPTLEIMPFDIQGDVEAFSAFKIARSARLSHPLVRDKILDALISRHEGMFLWVVLMLKELKACVTVEDVQSALTQLPTGLEAVYTAIVDRLEKTLTRGAIEVSRKVLAWVLGSGRPLSMDELREALCQQYKLEGNTLLANGQFPYADQEIEVICGSLVRIQFGRIQPVHETTTGFIKLLAGYNQLRTSPRILPDRNEISVRLAAICLAYIAEKCGSPLTRFADGILNVERFNMKQFRTQNAFIEYACAYWAYHVLECPSEF